MKKSLLVIITILSVVLLAGNVWALLVVPGDYETTEGSGDNSYPFNKPTMRYQQVYNNEEFSALDSFYIDEILFRPDSYAGESFSSTLPNVDIFLSTTSMDAGGLSSTFSDNIGSDETLVHSGALSLSSAFTGGEPKDFDIVITLSTPFLYDPSLGNLLLDVRNYSGAYTTYFDTGYSDSIQRLYSHDAYSSTGLFDGYNYGLITAFDITPVPEPATLLLLGSGLVGMIGLRRKFRQ